MIRYCPLLAIAAVLETAAPAASPRATSALKKLTLERIFASPSLSGPTPRAAALSPDGKFVTLLKPRADDRERYDLWAVDASTGAQRMLVDSLKVGSGGALSEAEKMRRERARVGGTRGIVEYSWAPDGRSILVPVDGDLFLAGLDGSIRRLTNTPESELDAHVSEAGRFVSFVRDQKLVALDLASGKERVLTPEAGGTVICGTAEFVAQEEMNRFAGAWWSPDDRRIAIECFDEAHVKIVTRAAIGANGTTTFDQRYPAAGSPNAAITLWLMNPDRSGRVKVDLGADSDFYLARADWSPDGRTLYVQRESRDQKRLDLLAADAATGATRIVFSETSPPWVDINDDFRALRDGSLLWASSRSGYRHLYRYAEGHWTQLTGGNWSLEENAQASLYGVVGVDEAAHKVFFTANRDDVLESQLYAVDYLHPGEPQRLTERGYWNQAVMDKAAGRALVSRSSPSQPPQVYLADASGRRIAWIEENKLDASHPYAPFVSAHRPVKFGTLTAADGSVLHYEMITPRLRAGKRYPVFFEHYGGPGSQQVSRSWMGPLPQYWVSRGFIYFQIDNRGSPNRGTAFENQIYHALGSVEVADQEAAARWVQKQLFVDPEQIAISGWSYGGYMTLKMLEKAPKGLYAAGIAGAPVTRWELYDTHYTERFLGSPVDNPAVYERSDAIAEAPSIRTPLLLIHGMSDDNVVFQNSSALVDRLQEAGTPFEMMLYVGQTHHVAGEARQRHVYETMERFLAAHGLGSGAR